MRGALPTASRRAKAATCPSSPPARGIRRAANTLGDAGLDSRTPRRTTRATRLPGPWLARPMRRAGREGPATAAAASSWTALDLRGDGDGEDEAMDVDAGDADDVGDEDDGRRGG